MKVRLARASGASFGVDDISCAAATQLGLFAAEGLEARWSDWRGGVAAMRAVLEGEADVAYAGFGPVLALRAEGRPCRIFVSQARALAQALVASRRFRTADDLRQCVWAVDAIGALSHHMARLVVRALGIAESDIRWEAVGPPPQRIAALLEGRADASLVRTEEALALDRDHAGRVHRMLDFDALKRLVPLQPHGVLATTEAFEGAHPAVLQALTNAMLRASRALHDDFEVFDAVLREHVTVALSTEERRMLWQREHDNGGWAVNGGMARSHWEAQLALFHELNPQLPRLERDRVLTGRFVATALAKLGAHPAPFDQGVTA
ncbi:MAG TPA: ABC transporter substrate-binding protein [Burkholderiales bacterium]|nr:ABC transporter substrate-binding protein [Burkholderiales bacterium]